MISSCVEWKICRVRRRQNRQMRQPEPSLFMDTLKRKNQKYLHLRIWQILVPLVSRYWIYSLIDVLMYKVVHPNGRLEELKLPRGIQFYPKTPQKRFRALRNSFNEIFVFGYTIYSWFKLRNAARDSPQQFNFQNSRNKRRGRVCRK